MDLEDRASTYSNIEILEREAGSIAPGRNETKLVFAHYSQIESDYILWINACHPLLSISTLENAVKHVLSTNHNSYTSVVPTTDWIFNANGQPVTNTDPKMLSSGHSKQYYKVAHAFHVISKEYYLQHDNIWTLTHNDPALIQIPIDESYDVNDEAEFLIAEAMYKHSLKAAL